MEAAAELNGRSALTGGEGLRDNRLLEDTEELLDWVISELRFTGTGFGGLCDVTSVAGGGGGGVSGGETGGSTKWGIGGGV